jgi:hypothetical protein
MTNSTDLVRGAARGAVAGAAATTALNAVTFLDMAVRGRPASSTPEETVRRGADLIGVPIPGEDGPREARVSGLGSLLGTAAGVGAGVVLGVVRSSGRPGSATGTFALAWAVAMLVGNGPMTALRVTDPRRWSAQDWAADVVPHLAYAAVAGRVLTAGDDREVVRVRGRSPRVSRR